MKVLKGFGVGILSLLLFLSLSVFGVAFMLNSTLLNPAFVASEVDKIDMSALTGEIMGEQVAEYLPEEMSFLEEAIYDVIEDQEPWLKEQVNTAIYSSYDFLLGKSDSLDLSISLEPLKESLRDSLWQTLNEQPLSELAGMGEYLLEPYIDQYFDELVTQVPEEYLPPELAALPEDQLKLYLEQNLDEFIELIPEEQLPPELSALLEEELEPYFNLYYEEFVGQVPDVFEFDESSIPPEVMGQLLLARQYIGYFQSGYYYLIGFMVLLVAGIFLINRNVKDTTRGLGITLLIYGAIEFAGVLVARNFIPTSLPLQGIPSSLQMWLVGLFGDLLAPLQTFSLGLLIGGVVLLAVSFVYRPRPAED